MKIVILDFSDEEISLSPKGYGGVGRTFAALEKSTPNCKVLKFPSSLLIPIKEGLSDFSLDEEFDIVLHTQTDTEILVKHNNKYIPTCVWVPGQSVKIHDNNKNILLHSPFQNIQCSLDSKIYNVILGIPIPEFKEYQRENFLFQCSNHYPQIQSIGLAKFCKIYGIKCVFAGPISENYKLLDEIDNINTFYLGEISESLKIDYLQKSKAFVSMYQFPINSDSLSFKQALSYNLPVITTDLGNPHGTIKDFINGFIIKTPNDFLNSIQHLFKYEMDQKVIYETSLKYSLDKMANSFMEAFENIINDKT